MKIVEGRFEATGVPGEFPGTNVASTHSALSADEPSWRCSGSYGPSKRLNDSGQMTRSTRSIVTTSSSTTYMTR